MHTSPRAAPAADGLRSVVIAAHDLTAGAVIAAGDVRLTEWPGSLRPPSALSVAMSAVGRRVAGPVGAGEVITSTRLVGRELTAGLPAGLIAAPIPLVDSAAAGLIRAGDHVDLLSPPSDAAHPATMVASAVLVLAVIPADTGPGASNAQLVVAVDQPTELRVAQAISTPMLATVINSP